MNLSINNGASSEESTTDVQVFKMEFQCQHQSYDFFKLHDKIINQGIIDEYGKYERILGIFANEIPENHGEIVSTFKSSERQASFNKLYCNYLTNKVKKEQEDKSFFNKNIQNNIQEIENVETKDEQFKEDMKIIIFIQLYGKKRAQNIQVALKELLESSNSKWEQIIRSKAYQELGTIDCSVLQYPNPVRIKLNFFEYGILGKSSVEQQQQKNTFNTSFYKIWEFDRVHTQFCQSSSNKVKIELELKDNFKGEPECGIFMTVDRSPEYELFKIAFTVMDIFPVESDTVQYQAANNNNNNPSSSSNSQFMLAFRLDGLPSCYRSFHKNLNYMHSDIVRFSPCDNFLLGAISSYPDLIKTQVANDNLLLICLNNDMLVQPKTAFMKMIQYFQSRKQIKYEPKLKSIFVSANQSKDNNDSKISTSGLSFYNSPLNQVIRRLLKQSGKQLSAELCMELSNQIAIKQFSLEVLNPNESNSLDLLLNNQQFAVKILKLSSLGVENFQLPKEAKDLESFLNDKLGNQSALNQIYSSKEQSNSIPDNFCKIQKIILTPERVIFCGYELIELSEQFPKKLQYSDSAIVYLREEQGLKQIDFEVVSIEEFHRNFEKYLFYGIPVTSTIKFYINGITSLGLERGSYFAKILDPSNDERKSTSVSKLIRENNFAYSTPIFSKRYQQIYVADIFYGQDQYNNNSNSSLCNRQWYINLPLFLDIRKEMNLDQSLINICSIELQIHSSNDIDSDNPIAFQTEAITFMIFDFYHNLANIDPDMPCIYILPQQYSTENQSKNLKILHDYTVNVFNVNHCESGFITTHHLKMFNTKQSEIQIKQSISKSIEDTTSNLFKNINNICQTQQFKEIIRENVIAQLQRQLSSNSFDLNGSFILNGRNSMTSEKFLENIHNANNHFKPGIMTPTMVQLKIPQVFGRFTDKPFKHVYIAKIAQKTNQLGKIFAFEVLLPDNLQNEIFQKQIASENGYQSLLAFSPEFDENILWPEFIHSLNTTSFLVITDQFEVEGIATVEETAKRIKDYVNSKSKKQQSNHDIINLNDNSKSEIIDQTEIDQNLSIHLSELFLELFPKITIQKQLKLLFHGVKQNKQQDISKEKYVSFM